MEAGDRLCQERRGHGAFAYKRSMDLEEVLYYSRNAPTLVAVQKGKNLPTEEF